MCSTTEPPPMMTPANKARRPTLVIVSGRPGSGKTTLARAIAQNLGCPLISRDEINEGIYHTFEHNPELAAKDQVAKATLDAFFHVIDILISADATLVAEAAFQHHRWRIGLQPLSSKADIKIIQCLLDPELAHHRITQRGQQQPDSPQSRRARSQSSTQIGHTQDFEPLSMPAAELTVSTVGGYEPKLNEIITFITSRQSEQRHG